MIGWLLSRLVSESVRSAQRRSRRGKRKREAVSRQRWADVERKRADAAATARYRAAVASLYGPPAGWYPDNLAPGRLRWWDGQRWTSHTQ